MAHRSQCSTGENPLDPNYLPPHYREEYRMAIDALVEADLEGYYRFLHEVDVVDFLSRSEIEYIRCKVQVPRQTTHLERRCMAEDVDGSSDTYWPVHSDHDAPNLDLGWPQQCRFVGPTEVTTLVNPSDPEMPSIKEQVRRMIKTAQQVIAVVMDMFTDVDIFADILGAATRGVAVYVLLDELNAQHFVGMVNNCRVNLDEIKFMRVRTVSGSTYSCRTGKTFKGQMMERFILVDCRAVLSGNYSFMWSFEKIHRCLAHLFLGQLVTTFDEEFRILFAHSEPLVVENVLANMPNYGGEPEGYYSTENTHMFNRQYPTMGMEWAERTGQDHMKVGQIMLPLRSESIHSAAEANPSVQRHMNLHDDQPYRGDHQSIEHGRQMRGPNEMVGFKRHSYGNIPDYEYLPPKNHPTMRGNQYMEGAVPESGYFAREPHIYQGAGLQSGYDMYGKFRGQGHIDQFTGSGYPHEGDEAEPPGTYDHVQRYLQSQCAMEEGHGPRNLLSPVQSNIKRHSMSQSYTCQSSPKQPNLPEQKLFFNVNHKPQDMSQKQGLRNWRISSYLSAYDDAGELDLAELEGSTTCGDVPCFTQEAPCGPVRAEIRPGNREFNRIPSPRENPMFVQLQRDYIVPDSSVNHPTDSQINIKTTSTSESSCTTEGDKVEETQNREPNETNRISEEFLRRKPSRPFQRGSRLRHSLIFSSNLELHTPDEMKDTAEEKDGDEASKLRGTHILDKRRTGSPFQPFQWSNFVKSNTFDNSTTESAQPEHELNKKGDNSDLDKVENSQNLQKKVPLQENDQPQPAVPEVKSQRDECPSNLLQKTSFMDMDDPDCRLRYFKELAAKRKLAAAKVPQSNPVKATQKFALPEKPCTNDADKNAGPVLKTSEITLKSKNTTIPAQEIKETCKDTKCEESREDVLHRATDAEKIRFKKKLAEESGSTSSFFQKDIDPTLKPVKEARTLSTAKNQTSPILKKCAQKPSYALSGESSDPCASSSSEPCSKKTLSTASATLEAQNRVESVAFNTPSTESGLIQFRGSKETDPSHAVLTESCPPVKLPKTKCMSPLSTTQNEGCLFAKDSQTIAQSSSNISSTCSDTVSLDLNSKPNLAIVDTCVPSKPDHIDTVPSPSSTTGISSAADSFHHLSETVEDFSRHFTIVGSEQSAAESACSQNPSAPEEKPSQQHALIEADSSEQPTTTESMPSQNTSTEADSSQHPPALETHCLQQLTALREESSLHPTSTESETSQNLPIKNVAEAFQQPTAVESKSSHHSTANTTTSSQQPTETEEDSQLLAKTQDSTVAKSEISKQLPVMETHPATNEPSQQCTATSSDSSNHPPAMRAKQNNTSIKCELSPEPFRQPPVVGAGSSQQPTATVPYSSQQPTLTIIDSTQQPTVTVPDSSQQPTLTITDSTQPTVTASTQQPTVTVPDSTQQPTVTVPDSTQQPNATVPDSTQQPNTTVTDSTQQPNATVTDSTPQPTVTVTDSTQQPTVTVPDSTQQPTVTVTDSTQQPNATVTDSIQQPNATVTDSTQQPNATVPDSTQQPNATVPDSTQQPTVTVTDSTQQPTVTVTDSTQQPNATVTDSTHQPTVTVTDSTQQPTVTVTDSTQQPSVTVPDSTQQPTVTVTDSTQQPTVTVTDSTQQPTVTVTDSTQQPTVTVPDSTQQPNATVTDSTQQPTVTETDASQQTNATVTDSTQQPTVTVTDSTQQPTVTVTDSTQQPTVTVTDSTQQPTVTVTDSTQQPTVTVTDSTQQPTVTVTDSTQQPTVTVTDSTQQPTVTVTDSTQQPTVTVTDSIQQPNATVTDSTQQPTVTVTDSTQQPTLTIIDSTQQPNATVTDSTQQPNATVTDSTQQPTLTIIDSTQQPNATVTDSTQQPNATVTDSTQQPTLTIIDSTQQPNATVTDSTQQPNATVTDSTQQPNATVTDSTQQPTLTIIDSTQQPNATVTDSTQQPNATVTDSTQQPTLTIIDSTQQPNATVTDSTQQPTLTIIDSTQQPNATVTDSTQQPTLTIIDSTQQPNATVTDSTQQPNATVTDSTQQPNATVTDSTQQPTVTVTDSTQQPTVTVTDSTQQPTATETDASQQPARKDTDFFHQSIAKETELSQHLTVTESESPQKSTEMMVDTSKHLIETKNESLQHITATESDCVNEKKKKDDKLSEGFSKPIPTDITQADNSISQITELSSTTEHSQSDTVPPCDSQTQAQTKPCTIHMVKDTDNDDSTQPQVSPELSLSSTQEITQLQSSISSNPTESRPNDPKPEKTDECQKNETITEQSQRHDTEITQTEVSTALDPKQTTPEVENSVTNFAEVSEKSNLTVHSNLQSSVEKNPKSVISAHQLSTANVISSSNLRDDTKVLLGQISAKNLSRSSQSKQTPAAPSEAKESVVSSADKLLSKHSGRPWSSKATPEERDMIIQKMEKMRKERRVYSRFDTS